MAQATANSASQKIEPHTVGAAFVQQYYQILYRSPGMAYRFYKDSSIVSHPNSDEEMTEVTTLQAINEKILSFNLSNYIAEIETLDSQSSYNEGVFVVVSGSLTGSNAVKRKFTQSFFLAPDDNGAFFVLNDIFRFVGLSKSQESSQILANGDIDSALEAAQTCAPETNLVQEIHAENCATPSLEDVPNQVEVIYQSENGESVVEDRADPVVSVVVKSRLNGQPDLRKTTSIVPDNGPKKSFASVVKVLGDEPFKSKSVPVDKMKTKVPPSTSMSSSTSTVPANGNRKPQDVGYSIHIGNLPSKITVKQVEEEFKKFGSIKPHGVQVRNHKFEDGCFGFVEYEKLESKEAAIKASTILIGDCEAHIVEKRTSTRVVNRAAISNHRGGGGFQQPRGGPRNESLRGNGDGNDNFSGNGNGNENFRGNSNYQGRGGNFGYGDFKNRGEILGRGRGRGTQRYVKEGNLTAAAR